MYASECEQSVAAGRFDCVSAIVIGEIHVELREEEKQEDKGGKVELHEGEAKAEGRIRVLTTGMAIEDVVKLRYPGRHCQITPQCQG